MPPPLQVDNIFVFIRQVAGLFRHVDYLRHQQRVDLLTLKVVSESCVTWATSVPILVFLVLSVLDLGPMYATDVTSDRCQTSDAHHRLMPPPIRGGLIILQRAGAVGVRMHASLFPNAAVSHSSHVSV